MPSWLYYPKSRRAPDIAIQVVRIFETVAGDIDSNKHDLKSNEVLSVVRDGLEQIGFIVETGKSNSEKIQIPVLFGMNCKLEKSFDADAFNEEAKMVLEVEAGRAVSNYQFLKDLFQACMMHDVEELVIAVRRTYKKSKDFDKVLRFFDTMYASQRLVLPLKGVLIVGY